MRAPIEPNETYIARYINQNSGKIPEDEVQTVIEIINERLRSDLRWREFLRDPRYVKPFLFQLVRSGIMPVRFGGLRIIRKAGSAEVVSEYGLIYCLDDYLIFLPHRVEATDPVRTEELKVVVNKDHLANILKKAFEDTRNVIEIYRL